jgi:hypothetical protein
MSSTTEFIKQIIGGPSDFGVGWLIILASSILGIAVIIFSFLRWIINKLQEKNRFMKIVYLLDTGTPISYFMNLLGNPVHINNTDIGQEYIFVNHYFYTQAITDSAGNISLFSITTRRKNFNPVLEGKSGSSFVVLGKTNFSKFSEPKRTIANGDHGGITFYSEAYYFGYDGNYHTYFFSTNPNGYNGNLPEIPESFLLINAPKNPEKIKKFRDKAIINTYTIDGFSCEKINDNWVFGPRYNQIRVFTKK